MSLGAGTLISESNGRVRLPDIAGRDSLSGLAYRTLADRVIDAQIASLSVGKLTAGTISADVIIGGMFKTAASPATRIELNSNGLRYYNSSIGSGLTPIIDLNTVTGVFTFSTGIAGTARSEMSATGGFRILRSANTAIVTMDSTGIIFTPDASAVATERLRWRRLGLGDSIDSVQVYLDWIGSPSNDVILNLNARAPQSGWDSFVSSAALDFAGSAKAQWSLVSGTTPSWLLTILEAGSSNERSRILALGDGSLTLETKNASAQTVARMTADQSSARLESLVGGGNVQSKVEAAAAAYMVGFESGGTNVRAFVEVEGANRRTSMYGYASTGSTQTSRVRAADGAVVIAAKSTPVSLTWNGDYLDWETGASVTTSPASGTGRLYMEGGTLRFRRNDGRITHMANKLMGRIRATTDQTITTGGGAKKVNWDTTQSDDGGFADFTNERFTFPKAGKYYITANLRWDGHATGIRIAYLVRNGNQTSADTLAISSVFPSSTTVCDSHVCGIFDFADNDYVEVYVYHESGVDRKIFNTNFNSNFSYIHISG